jgi:hypothetical protein
VPAGEKNSPSSGFHPGKRKRRGKTITIRKNILRFEIVLQSGLKMAPTPDRWHRIEALYHAALERDPAGRAAFLDSGGFACRGH